jgi:hypothetical protein
LKLTLYRSLTHTSKMEMLNLALDCFVAFVGGAAYEAGCVGWVHFAERGRPMITALFSMLCATAQVAGIGESVQTLYAAPFFVVGYGAGTYAAVRFKRRWTKSEST